MSVEKIILIIISLFFQSFAITTIIFMQKKNVSNIKKVLFLIFMWIYCILSFIYIKNQFRFVLCIFVSTLILYFILNINDRKIIIYTFNSMVLLSFSEIIISLFLVLCGLNSKLIVNNMYYNLLTNILISLFSVIIISLPFIKKIIFKIIELFDKNNKLINYFCVILIVIYLIILKNGFEFLMMSNYYINILFMFSLIGVVFIILKNESKYEQLKDKNKQMLNYVIKYEKIITAQGKANHEFKNQLMVIRGYAQMNSNKIIDYIDEIVKDSNKAGSSYLISQLNNFPDGGIKGLLYYKLSIMEDEKIKYSINVEKGVKSSLKSLNIGDYKNITKILGVLLDNAIDASKKSKHKKINISVIKDKKNIIFKIYNTYKGKVDIDKVGTGYTTKGTGHGYGLRLVKDIINEDKLFNISHNLEDNYFVSSLYIKK